GCLEASTVHVAGTLEELAAAEAAVWRGEHPARPFVMVCQQSQFDPTRAPPGKHTGYAYCHVPSGSTVDLTGHIEQQIERFAPGFRERILARHVTTPHDLERDNPNYVGGAATGGVADLFQLFTRPVASIPIRRRIPACSCARRRRRPAAAFMACADFTRRARRSAGSRAGRTVRSAETDAAHETTASSWHPASPTRLQRIVSAHSV